MEEQLALWNEFYCSECEFVWKSERCNPVMEFCPCGTGVVPELLGYEDDA